MKKVIRQSATISRSPHLRWTLALVTGALIAVPLGGCGSSGTGGGGGINGGGASDAVATVGGQPIKRADLDSFLEAVYGEGALSQMIDNQLVMQKLKASGLTVTDAEVNAALDERAKQTPQVAAVVKAGGARKDALLLGTRNELAINKLVTKDIKVTEAQLKTWFEKNRMRYDLPERVKMGILASSTQIKATTMAQQLKSQNKTFKELVAEQMKANDPVGRRSVEETDYPLSSLPPNMKAALAKLKPNDVTPLITLGAPPQALYVILHLIAREPAQKADFTKLKSKVETDYKMEQLAMHATPSPGMGGPNGMGQQTSPMQQAAQALLTQLHGDAATSKQVQVSDPTFEAVGKQYATAPVMPSAAGGPGAMGGGAAPSGAAPRGAAPSGAPKVGSAPKSGSATKP